MKPMMRLGVIAFIAGNALGQDVSIDVKTTQLFNPTEIDRNYAYSAEIPFTTADQKKFCKHFKEKIKDTSDYKDLFIGEEEFKLDKNQEYIKFDNGYISKKQIGWKSPEIYNNGVFAEFREVPKIDPETGENVVDDEGDPIYITEKLELKVEDYLSGFGANERWVLDKKGFVKKPITTTSLLSTYDDKGNFKGNLVSFVQYNSSNTVFDKSMLFKEDVVYDYVFYPTFLKNGKGKEEDKLLKAKDIISFALNDEDIKSLIPEIINSLVSGDLKVENSKGKKIEFDKKLISYEMEIPKFDPETGENVVDEEGNPVYSMQEYHYDLSNYCGIRFYEDWYFDKEKVGVFKKVNKAKLLVYEKNDQGEIVGYKQLPFTILFE